MTNVIASKRVGIGPDGNPIAGDAIWPTECVNEYPDEFPSDDFDCEDRTEPVDEFISRTHSIEELHALGLITDEAFSDAQAEAYEGA